MRYDTIIDSRDLANRLEELREMKQAIEDAEERLQRLRIVENPSDNELEQAEKALEDAKEAFGEDEASELKDLENAESEIPEFTSGNTLVPRDEWIEYVEELVKDIGDLPKKIPHYIVIDWEATAKNIEADYSEIEIQGTTFLYRNC